MVSVDGFFSDSCWSYAVGEVKPEIKKLMDVTKKALFMGIDQCVPATGLGTLAPLSNTTPKTKMAMAMSGSLSGTVSTNDARRSHGSTLREHGQGLRLEEA